MRTEAFTISKNLLTSGADALERIISSYKEVNGVSLEIRLFYCCILWRLPNWLDTPTECTPCYTSLTIVFRRDTNELLRQSKKLIMSMLRQWWKEKSSWISEQVWCQSLVEAIACLFWLEGEIIESDEDIIAENVPIITPNGDIIVESLSLKVTCLNNDKERQSSRSCFRSHQRCMCLSRVRMGVANPHSFASCVAYGPSIQVVCIDPIHRTFSSFLNDPICVPGHCAIRSSILTRWIKPSLMIMHWWRFWTTSNCSTSFSAKAVWIVNEIGRIFSLEGRSNVSG